MKPFSPLLTIKELRELPGDTLIVHSGDYDFVADAKRVQANITADYMDNMLSAWRIHRIPFSHEGCRACLL